MTPELHTIDDLMRILGIGRSTVYKLKTKDGWPHLLIGVQVRFTDAHIESILKSYEKTPTTKRRPNVGTRARRSTK
jgi:predicted DNA-binding transcriptional regulator AlpA